MSLAVLVVLAAAVGAVGAIGTVGAQDDGTNTNTTANATDGGFYHPSNENPVNARFRDCCSNTVDSTDGGVLNFYIVNGLYDGDPYDVSISASNLSEEQVDEITFDNDTEFSPYGLDRGDIVGMDFSGVPAGDYDFTVDVVGEDAGTTVPLSVTGENGSANATGNATNATSNESAGNATATGNATDTTVVAAPSAANTSANHTVSTVVGADAAGNLSKVTVNYGASNTSIGLVGGKIYSANLNEQVITDNSTIPTVGAQEENLSIGFDGTVQVEQGDRLNLTYGGVTNPSEAGNYTVGVAVNNGSFQNTTFQVAENGTSANGTAGNGTGTAGNATGNGTAMGNATGNTTVVAAPSTANTSANYTVSTMVGQNATGNLSKVTVNYGASNASIGLVGGKIYSANLNEEVIINNSTIPTVGAQEENLSIGFDGTRTVSEGDRLNVTFGGVTNPPEAGNYTVGVAVNNGSFENTTLVVTENATGGMGGANATNATNATTGTTATSAGTTGGETAAATGTNGGMQTEASTSGAGTSGGGAGTNGSGGQQGTEAGGPGFGIAIAVVALLAAALVAVRRN